MKYYIDLVLSMVGAILGALFGKLDGLLIALLVFMALDYITGVINAIYSKTLSSEVGFKGLLRKALILIVVIVGHILDIYVLKVGSTVRSGVCLFYISNEGISILENAANIGLPLPDKLKKILEEVLNDD